MGLPNHSSGCLELDTCDLSLANTYAALAELTTLADQLAENSQQVVQGDVLHKRPAIAKLTQHLSEIRQHAEQHAVRLQARVRRILMASIKLDRCHVSTARVSQGSGRARRPATRKAPAAKSSDSDGGPAASDEDAPHTSYPRFTPQQHSGPQPPNTPHRAVTSPSIVIANRHTYVHRTWPARHVINAAMILVHSKQRRSPQEEVQCD